MIIRFIVDFEVFKRKTAENFLKNLSETQRLIREKIEVANISDN